MHWKKLGKIYNFETIDKYAKTHASNPLAIHINDNIFRVFFSSRDVNNKSSIAYVDIDIIKRQVISKASQTIFKYGGKNSFYSHGSSVGNLYSVNNINYILFMGWQIRGKSHWRGEIGRLKLESNKLLELSPQNTFLPIDKEDPVSLSYPWVIFDEGIYKMWYGSTISWSSENGEMIHIIKYAESKDGNNWKKYGLAVPYELGKAQAFSRPTVIREDDGYHMWFSYRSGDGSQYRIGYAHSLDGLSWDRKDNSGIDVSETGWDSEMICYPFVFNHSGKKYMLYNGNGYGMHGFGLAVFEG